MTRARAPRQAIADAGVPRAGGEPIGMATRRESDTGGSKDKRRRRGKAPRAGTASQDLRAFLAPLFDAMFEGVQILDFEWRYLYLNNAAAQHGRRPRHELIGRTMMEVYPGIDQTEMFGLLRRCMTERTPQHMVNAFTYPDGQLAWFDLRMDPVPMGVLILSVDVTERRATIEELRRSREDLVTTLQCMADGVITTDVAGHVTGMNPAAEALIGRSEEDAQGHALDELIRFVNQKTGEPVEHPVDKVLRDGLRIGLANDTVLVAHDGRRTPIASSGAPLRDASGAIRGVVLVLRDMKQEHELTAQLQQAQKMEAIGRLAGGVAHDFNNLLTVISGYSELVLQNMTPDHEFRTELEEIHHAGAQAASLTRQLLAFSRRQVLQPEVLDVNEIVGRMDRILRRLIGEDIDVVTRLRPKLDLVLADHGQIEQIIMNLVVNARDAMPSGGRLTLETANVTLDDTYVATHPDARSGPHVMIAVSDTGSGMDAETQARIFEPFFTTKERGKGTGLGLSTVYGIVKQSGGNVWVYSEVGRGTTFKLYFPRAEASTPLEQVPAGRAPAPTGQTILVVEDQPAVRALITSVLEKAGYRVVAAGDPDGAVSLCRQHDGDIDLLLTDVVLPGADGRELARRVLALRPGVRVVYMSGYTDDAIVHHGVLEPGTAFIEKPITADMLLRKVREYLS
jgi:two-component system, cell cycle sensor histidine kinase and response regulator CckA